MNFQKGVASAGSAQAAERVGPRGTPAVRGGPPRTRPRAPVAQALRRRGVLGPGRLPWGAGRAAGLPAGALAEEGAQGLGLPAGPRGQRSWKRLFCGFNKRHLLCTCDLCVWIASPGAARASAGAGRRTAPCLSFLPLVTPRVSAKDVDLGALGRRRAFVTAKENISNLWRNFLNFFFP